MEKLEKLKRQFEAEQTKWNDLKVERDQIQGDIDILDNRFHEMNPPGKDPIKEAAKLMLNGKYNAPGDISPLLTKRDDLATKRRVILIAIKMQEDIVNTAHYQYSKAFGESRRSEYQAIVKAQVRAVVALARVIETERAFRESLFRDKGLSFGAGLGHSMIFTATGELRDRHSKASYYLRQVVSAGWITEIELEEMKTDA
jgi:hypothetical protein